MKLNVYDIGTMCLGISLGALLVSDIPIVKKVILMALIGISTIQYIILKMKIKKE